MVKWFDISLVPISKCLAFKFVLLNISIFNNEIVKGHFNTNLKNYNLNLLVEEISSLLKENIIMRNAGVWLLN